MLDLLFVWAPAEPTTKWTTEVDGVFRRRVQEAFNLLLPPGVSKELGRLNTIGRADSSAVARLLGALPQTLNPLNYRLRSSSHDPILGFLFGVSDMRCGTCTVVGDGDLKIYQSTSMEPVDGGLFSLLGRLSRNSSPGLSGQADLGWPVLSVSVLPMRS